MKINIMTAVACFCLFALNHVATAHHDSCHEEMFSMEQENIKLYEIVVPVINILHKDEVTMKSPLIYAGSRRDRQEDEGTTGYTGGTSSGGRDSSERGRERRDEGMTGYTGGMSSGGHDSSERARDRDEGMTGYTGGRRSGGNETSGTRDRHE